MASGLSSIDANRILKKVGENILVANHPINPLVMYFSTYRNPLVIVLIIVGTTSLILGNTIDGLLIYAMVMLSTILDFVQEYRAHTASRALQSQVASKTRVWRDGRLQLIDSTLLVPDDIVMYEPGDVVSADAVINAVNDLYINQSTITGESFPVSLGVSEMLYAGSSIISGTATATVVATGKKTQLGKIAKSLESNEKKNAFTKGVNQFSATVVRIIMVFVLVIFAIMSVVRGSVFESLMFAIAVAVGLTPEFLPMVMTITMSRGSVKMAKHGVIVKKLSAIPSFGSMQVLCTDKTGTLTEDHITLVKYENCQAEEDVSVLNAGYMISAHQTSGKNPIDAAIVEYGAHADMLGRKIDEIPFDFNRKRMSVVIEESKEHTLYCKGAPESIIEICSHYQDEERVRKITKIATKKIMDNCNKLSEQGYRLLFVAKKTIKSKHSNYSKADESGLILLGLLAFMDPVKTGIKQTLDKLESIGIKIKVITGDNEIVTRYVCKQADIPINDLLIGSDVDKLSNEELYEKTQNTSIFARCNPTQKERIIEIMRQNGVVVGYMGDGINDAPSLHQADVGISVSNAVDVAKEAADIVLTKRDLMQLIDGVIEGRKTFGNTMKYILMGLSSNFGNMCSVLSAILFLPFLPMLPIQILLNNFLYDISQITLPFDDVDSSYVQTPSIWNIKSIMSFMSVMGPISTIFDLGTFAILYRLFGDNPAAFQTGWFMESLATQALVIHIIRTSKVPLSQSNAHPALWISTIGITIIGWIIPYTNIGKYFGFVGLPHSTLLLLIFIIIGYLLSAEFGKRTYYHYQSIARQT